MRRSRWKLWRTPAKMDLYHRNKYQDNYSLLMFIWAFVTHIQTKRPKLTGSRVLLTKSLLWASFLLLSSTHCLCRLPPSFSLFFLLYPQTLSSVFPLHRWVIPRQNNGLLCFIELPLSFSHFLFSFPPFICRALFLFRSLFSFLLSSQFWEEAKRNEHEWRMHGFVWNGEGKGGENW